MASDVVLDDYPCRASDKIRYGDTDRQGHVNNAVFATLLETGRTEILYNHGTPLAGAGSGFVLARLVLDFRSEIRWPGTVEIGTRVASLGRSSIKVEQALFQKGRCVAMAEAVLVLMDETTRRSRPLPPNVIERLSSLMAPDRRGDSGAIANSSVNPL
jgi:acyl-CoA thioester hydrolase